jgi:hypothetical protein
MYRLRSRLGVDVHYSAHTLPPRHAISFEFQASKNNFPNVAKKHVAYAVCRDIYCERCFQGKKTIGAMVRMSYPGDLPYILCVRRIDPSEPRTQGGYTAIERTKCEFGHALT